MENDYRCTYESMNFCTPYRLNNAIEQVLFYVIYCEGGE